MHASLRLSRSLVVFGLLAVPFAGPLVAQGKLYFVGNGVGPDPIRRTNVDGSGVVSIVDGLTFPQTIAVDGVADKLYWTNNDNVHRSNLDGSNIETLLSTGGSVRGIALDVPGGKMYVTDTLQQKIWRANLDGSALEEIVSPGDGLNIPSHIAVDGAGGKIYWTEQNDQQVMRANLDGSDVEELHQCPAYGITLDVDAGHVYWTEQLGKMMRSDLDGSNPVELFDDVNIMRGVALDPGNGKIYWAGLNPTRINRANLDGSELENLANYVNGPQGIFLDLSDCDAQPGPWTDLGGALAGTTGTPALAGSGTMLPGCPIDIELGNAAQSAPAFLIMGTSVLNAPFHGGVLVPSPSAPGFIVSLQTGFDGNIAFTVFWPVGVPPGFDVVLQYWILDAGGPDGFAASNGITRTSP